MSAAPALADCGNTALKLDADGQRERVLPADIPARLASVRAEALVMLPTGSAIAAVVRAAWRGRLVEIGAGMPLPEVGGYAGLGADRIVAGLAAPHPSIVVDAGTATTLSAWNAVGRFAGGLIVPGVHALVAGLAALAPALPVVEPLSAATSAARHGTAEAIAAGCGIGHPAMVLACLARLQAETGISTVVLTGAGAEALAGPLGCTPRPWLVLDGLKRLVSDGRPA